MNMIRNILTNTLNSINNSNTTITTGGTSDATTINNNENSNTVFQNDEKITSPPSSPKVSNSNNVDNDQNNNAVLNKVSFSSTSLSSTNSSSTLYDTISYDAQKMIGHGSFGAVFLAKIIETDEIVAIKKVLQDKRFKNRELQIMKILSKKSHPYIVTLRHHFISKGSQSDDIYLNLVLDFVPETLYSIAKQYVKASTTLPLYMIKIYMYQLARALAHIHGMGICHRDIKPQNLLINPTTFKLKLCDFGSAKLLISGELNVAYICSRYYRAPELIFGSSDYSIAIDIWSYGCVISELFIGTPFFAGGTGVDQLVEIIKVLGTPSKDELKTMNPNYQEFKFPQIRAHPWETVFSSNITSDAIKLISNLLVYSPSKRLKAIEACGHSFFDDLRQPDYLLPTNDKLPIEMFTFTDDELVLSNDSLNNILIPNYMKNNKILNENSEQNSSK